MNETPLTLDELTPKQQRTFQIVRRICLALNKATPTPQYFVDHYTKPVVNYYRNQGIDISEELLKRWNDTLERSEEEDLLMVKLERSLPVVATRYVAAPVHAQVQATF